MKTGIVAIMFLKNDNRYVHGFGELRPKYTMLEQNLLSLRSFVDGVYIFDDNSNDGSWDVYARYVRKGLILDWKVHDNKDQNKTLNELIAIARENNHHWIVNPDGDEIFDDDARAFMVWCARNYDHDRNHCIRFNYINLWRSRKKYRTDKWYLSETGKFMSLTPELVSLGSMFNDHHFMFRKPNGDTNFGTIENSEYNILHYAWVDWEFLSRKVDRYIRREIEHRNIPRQEAEKMFSVCMDEEGARFSDVDLRWCEEFRSGNISYSDMKIPSNFLDKKDKTIENLELL